MASRTLLTLATFTSLCAASNVWTVDCAPLTVQRSDPIIAPGVTSAHVHAIVGSTAFSRNMTGIDSAAIGLATTCDKWTDHSAYWAPNLYQMTPDGKFKAVPFTGMVSYYQNYTCDWNASSPGICPDNRNPAAFPDGLRMIAGDPFRRTLNLSDPWQQAVLMEVGNRGEIYGMPTVLDSDRLSGHVRWPSCWDGVNLDSANHRDHVSYPDASLGGTTQGGMCPQSHPIAMINVAGLFGWNIINITDPTTLVWAQGDTTGYGFHGDFYMGWKNRTALQQSFANCFTNDNCPWREFGSPDGSDLLPTARTPETPAPPEDVGLVNALDALPGNNPVYVPPVANLTANTTVATSTVASVVAAATTSAAAAAPVSGTVNNTTSAVASLALFSDATQSLGWKYIGCGSDSTVDRTFTGSKQATSSMFPESCIRWCMYLGYSYAGVEYSSECYCGNTLPTDRAPTGTSTNCNMACSGNSTVACGGSNALSIYQSCQGSAWCVNAVS